MTTDSDKLRFIAAWFDLKDAELGATGADVQNDLRRIADYLDKPELLRGVLDRLVARIADEDDVADPRAMAYWHQDASYCRCGCNDIDEDDDDRYAEDDHYCPKCENYLGHCSCPWTGTPTEWLDAEEAEKRALIADGLKPTEHGFLSDEIDDTVTIPDNVIQLFGGK